MLERHKLYKHSFKPPCNYMCAHCDKRFPKQFRLKVHEFYKHGIEHPDIKVSIVFLLLFFLSPRFLEKMWGILLSPPSICQSIRLSVCLSVMLSPPKPLDRIQPNLVSGLLTQVGSARAPLFLAPPPGALGRGQKVKY